MKSNHEDNDRGQIVERKNCKLFFDNHSEIRIVHNDGVFCADGDAGLFELLQAAPGWYVNKGYVETLIADTHIPLANIVWTYFHGILSEVDELRDALLYAQKYLAQRELVIDHLLEHKWNNHLYALAAMPRDSNASFGNLRTRIRYPCFFHVVYDHARGVYKVKCGIDKKKYVKRFVFGDLTSEAECARLKDCLLEFRTAVGSKGFTLDKPGDDNLLFRANHEKALDYHMPALERMVRERLSMYRQYEKGCFKDVSKLLKTQLKKYGTPTKVRIT